MAVGGDGLLVSRGRGSDYQHHQGLILGVPARPACFGDPLSTMHHQGSAFASAGYCRLTLKPRKA